MDAMLDEILEGLEDGLVTRAFLYDHPATYRTAVEAVFTALRARLERVRIGPRDGERRAGSVRARHTARRYRLTASGADTTMMPAIQARD